MPTPFDDGRVYTARQRRTLERVMTRVTAWHAAIPTDRRRPFYSGQEIAAAVQLDAGQTGPALRALGWRYALRRLAERDGLPVAIWAPPGAPEPRRPIGRPRTTHPETTLPSVGVQTP